MIRRARRWFGIAILILVAGLMAVAVGVVYRVGRDDGQGLGISSVALPAGAEVVSALVADGRLTITFRRDGQTFVRVVDTRDGTLRGEVQIVAE